MGEREEWKGASISWTCCGNLCTHRQFVYVYEIKPVFREDTHLQHLLPADMFWNSIITRMAFRCVLSGLTHYNFIQSVPVFNCLLLLFFMQETQPETSELKQLCLACILPSENRAYKLQWNLPFTCTFNNLPQSTCTGRIKGLGHCSEEPSHPK